MVKAYEYKGLWWLPSDEETKLFGTLTIEKGKSVLETTHHFGHKVISETGDERVLSMAAANQARIVGITTDGKHVTLEECAVSKSSFHFPGIATASYRAQFALIGKQFGDGEAAGFDEIAIHASDLNAWTCISGFQHKIDVKEHREARFISFTKVTIDYAAPEPIEIALDSGESATIKFNARNKGIGPGTDSVSISQDAALHLHFANRCTLEEVTQRAGQLRNFLSLAVGRPVAILSLTGFRDDFARDESNTPLPIELFWAVTHNPDPPTNPRKPFEMLFTLPEATPNISEVMKAWFARQAFLRPVFNLYFGMLYHPSMYLDVRFLAYAQAVETYDFRRRDPHELPPREHKKRLSAILDATPAQWHEWFRMKLASSNYLTLDQRIRDVLAECADVSTRIAGATAAERDAFITTFKRSRNYYTHYNPKLEKEAATGAALYLLVVQLQAIIEMSLLRELGFPCEAIDAILARVQRYAEIAHFRSLAQEVE